MVSTAGSHHFSPLSAPTATSSVPTIGRKRRFSVTDYEDEDMGSVNGKRARNVSVPLQDEPLLSQDGGSGQEDTKDTKSFAQGVKEDGREGDKDESPVQPEDVPLPESPAGTPPPEVETPTSVQVSHEEAQCNEKDDTTSISCTEEETKSDTSTLSSEEETLHINPDESQSADAATPLEEDDVPPTSPAEDETNEA